MDMLVVPSMLKRRRRAGVILALGLLMGGWVASAQAYFGFGLLPGIYTPQTYYKYGAVYTRAIVPGPNKRPVYVEYDSTGKEVREIGEAIDRLERVQVMSGDSYRAYLQRLKDSQARYPDGQVLTAKDYRSRSFKTVDGKAITKPPLDAGTLTVLVRADQQLFDASGKDLVLLQLPIRSSVVPNSSSQSLLLSDVGEIIHQTANAIGFRVGFFGKDGKVSQAPWRDHESEIYGPLPGTMVTMGSHVVGGNTMTDVSGKFSMRYKLPPCPGFYFPFTTPVYLELYYKRFNPRGTSYTPYYMVRQDEDSCNGLGVWSLGAAAVVATMATPLKIPRDFPVDLMVLDGAARFGNVKFGDETAYNAQTGERGHHLQEKYDFDGDGKPDWVVPGKKVTKQVDGQSREVFVTTTLAEAELQGIYLTSHYDAVPASTEDTGPDFTRLIDTAPDFEDRGLLSSISKADLLDTDIYVFRESNGQLVAERRGLMPDELNKNYSGVDQQQGSFRYTIQLRGSVENYYTASLRTGEANFTKLQSAGGFRPEFQKYAANHLKAGEVVRIIAINRPTGYMGSAKVQLQSAVAIGNRLNFDSQQIELAPPNLKVWAERKNKIEQGMTKGEVRKQLIGNEGAGLGSDVSIAIYTDWRDADGSPLPEEMADYGYTGRLAKIVAANQLAPVGANSLSQFKIKPGQQVQVIQLPEKVLAKQHLYLQVAGQPDNRNPDFSSKGDGQGILKYRPTRYVPVQVPLHDEEGTELARQAFRKASSEKPELKLKQPEPIYTWNYRPELQFSLYDLNVKEIRREYPDGDTHDVLPSKYPVIGAGDKYLAFIYDLLTSQIGALEAWDIKGEREMTLALGSGEVKASVGADKTVRFENIAQLSSLQESDFLVLRLYTNNDMANVLWEYAFNKVYMYPESSPVAPLLELSADEAGEVPYSAVYPMTPDAPVGMRWSAANNQPVTFDPPFQRSTDGVFKTTAKLPTKSETIIQVLASDLDDVKNKFFAAAYKIVPGNPAKLEAKESGKTAVSGFGEFIVDIDVRDQFDNPVSDGTAVDVSSSDMKIEADKFTTGGHATIKVRGGFTPGVQNLEIAVGSVKKTIAVNVHDVTLSIDFPSKIEVGRTVPLKVTASSSYGSLQGFPIELGTVRAAVEGRIKTLDRTNSVTIDAFVGDFIGEGRVFASFADRIERKTFEVVDTSPVQLLDRVLVAGVPGKGSFNFQGRTYEYTSKTGIAVKGAPGEVFTASLMDYLAPPLLPELRYSMQSSTREGQIQDSIIGVPAQVNRAERVMNRFEQNIFAYDLKSGGQITLDYERLKLIRNPGLVVNVRPQQPGTLVEWAAVGIKLTLDGASRFVLSRTEGTQTVELASAAVDLNSWHKVGAHYINGQLVLQVDERVYKSDELIPLSKSSDSTRFVLGNGLQGLVSDLFIYDWDAEKVASFEGGGLESSVTIGASGTAVMKLGASPANLFAVAKQRKLEYWRNREGSTFFQTAYAAEEECKPVDPGKMNEFDQIMGAGAAYAHFIADCKLLPKMKKALVTVKTEKGVWKKSVAVAELGVLTSVYMQTKLVELQLILGPQCLKGAVTGNVQDVGSAVCDIVTSFFLIGDLRDFAIQSKYFYWDEDLEKFDYPTYVFSGLGIAADLASLAGVGIPFNLGLAGAKTGAKIMRGPYMQALAEFLYRKMDGDLANADKVLPALKGTLPLLQLTAAVILFKDDVKDLYEALSNIKPEQLSGIINYAAFAMKQVGAELIFPTEASNDYLTPAYAIDKDGLLKLLGGGTDEAGSAIKKLILNMQSAHTKVRESKGFGDTSHIGQLFIQGLSKFGDNIDELTNDELIAIVTNDKFLSALIYMQQFADKGGRTSQDVIESVRRFKCTASACGWPNGIDSMEDFFGLFDKIASKHHEKFESDEALGSLQELIRDMGQVGDSKQAYGTAKGATESLIQMVNLMDQGWTLVRAEKRYLPGHVHDLAMIKDGKIIYIEVKNWQMPEGLSFLWSSMKGGPEDGTKKAGQLYIDLVHAFSMPRDKIDVQWRFAARSGDVSKIIDYLMESANKNPERVLVILNEAGAVSYHRLSEIMQKPQGARQREIGVFMNRELLPVLEKIMISGGKLSDVAG